MSVLRSLFGPSQAEIWQQLAREIGANYSGDGFWTGAKVAARHNQWTITLDTFTVSTGKSSHTYTRMRAPYVNPDGFRFTIYRKSVFTDLGKWLGMQDVLIGDPHFDDAFVIKGNDEKKLRHLFANQQLKSLIGFQPTIQLTVRDDEGWFGTTFPQGVDELHFHVGGVIKDINRLKLLYDLFAETLEELCRMGSAYEGDPKVTL
jgi:hypothetical protein